MRHATIVHPRLLEALVASGFFPFTATIQAPTRVPGTAGGVTTTWATVPGLEAIPATKDVTGGVEQRGPEMIVEEIFTRVQLAGYFAQIDESMRCLLDDGTTWDIFAADADPMRTMSQLTCRKVTPTASPGE